MKKGNAGIVVLIILLFLVVIAMSGFMVHDYVNNKNGQSNNNTTDKYEEYVIGEEVKLSNGTTWLVIDNSDSSKDYVTVIGKEEYLDEGFENYDALIDELYVNTTDIAIEYKNSKLKEHMDSRLSNIPVEVKEVNGYKIRLITLEEIFKLDNAWEKNKYGSYNYTGNNLDMYSGNHLSDYLLGVMTMTSVSSDYEGKRMQYYSIGASVCHPANISCNDNYFISGFKVGIGGLNPVINLYKKDVEKIQSDTRRMEKVNKNKGLIYEYIDVVSKPAINIKSDVVQNINEQISDLYDVSDNTLTYEWYLNEDILSFVLTISSKQKPELKSHKIYNVNIYTGKTVTNSEILKLKNISETEYINKLKIAYNNYFTQKYANYAKDDIYYNALNNIIADNNLSVDTPMFMDGFGKINVSANIYELSGAQTNRYIVDTGI